MEGPFLLGQWKVMLKYTIQGKVNHLGVGQVQNKKNDNPIHYLTLLK